MRSVFFGRLHPFLVHFAVALLLVAPACDALGVFLRREALLQAGRWNTLLGAGAALASALTGLLAASAVDLRLSAGAPLLELHRALGLLLVALWVPLATWRAFSRVALPLRLRTVYLTISFVGAAMVLTQAGLGSVMVYRHGVGLRSSAHPTPAAQK